MARYYFAYGSNLSVAHMRVRCPKAVRVAQMWLDDAALVFRGVADVTRIKGGSVPGGLWRITEQCEAALDRYEGVASDFYLKRFVKAKIRGKKHDVLFYQMKINKGVMPPSEAYLDVIAQGYGDFGLPLEYLDAAVRASWDSKKVTETLARRHWRKGRPTLAAGL